MKPTPTNLITEEIFARWPAHFCRVARAAAGNCGLMLKKLPVFQVFHGWTDLFSRGTTVAEQPLRTKLK